MVENFDTAEGFVAYVSNHKGEEILVNGMAVVPRLNSLEGEGALGVTIQDVGVESQNIFISLWSGLKSAVTTTWLIGAAFVGLLASIFGGNLGVVDQVTGPVGVFSILGEVSQLGIASLLQFLGLISLNLVIINMIPFPAQDGGRFITILIEKVVGKKLSNKVELVANGIGFALLILLMVVVTIKDITNIL